jgi:hypothetical protein
MWGTILQFNSVIFALSAVYSIYSLGTAIITWSWKQFVIALILCIFFGVIEVTLAALAEP